MIAGPPQTGASAPPPYFEALRHQLVEAATARASRPRRRWSGSHSAAAAVALTVAAATAVFSVAPQQATAAVDVRRAGDRIELRLLGEDVDPEQVQRAVEKAGLRISIVRRPVGPSLVDRFVGAISGPLPASFTVLDERTGTFRGFSVPASWPGTIRLGLGEPARGDERYAVTSDAFAPGEPLACHDVRGLSAPDAAVVLRSIPRLRVRWELHPAGEAARPTTPRRSSKARVVAAIATSRSEVVVSVIDGTPTRSGGAIGCRGPG